MTLKIYDKNPYLQAFEATVIACKPMTKGYGIQLNQTAFYPEGGGQPADQGTLNDLFVHDVQLIDGEPIHFVHDCLEIGQVVQGQLDWARRYDFMQQHSGQHVLSAVLEHSFNTATIGFHLTKDTLTIDTNSCLSDQDWFHIEEKVNHLIWKNLNVIDHFPSQDQLSDFKLRKQPKVTTSIRLIELEGYDTVPCGGTHVHTTAEIGLIRVLRIDKYKIGQRVSFSCGQRALTLMQRDTNILKNLSTLVSVPIQELPDAIEQLHQKIKLTQKNMTHLAVLSATLKADQLKQSVETISSLPLICYTLNQDEAPLFNHLPDALADREDSIIVLINRQDTTCTILINCGTHSGQCSAKDVLIQLQNHYAVKGGGSPQRVQCQTTDEALLQGIENHIKGALLSVITKKAKA
jgi:alanyl-tRNA synthetase